VLTQMGAHEFLLSTNCEELELVCAFAPQAPVKDLPDFNHTRAAHRALAKFWEEGGRSIW